MHEMGHGLGFKHSGRDENEYADKSGYMGYAINEFGMPRKAFVSSLYFICYISETQQQQSTTPPIYLECKQDYW